MKTTLAVEGLSDLNLANVVVNDIHGTEEIAVAEVCDELYGCAEMLRNYSRDLEDQVNNILGDLEGMAAEVLRSEFPTLLDAFEAVPSSIISIADWADYASKRFLNSDSEGAMRLHNAAVGGEF